MLTAPFLRAVLVATVLVAACGGSSDETEPPTDTPTSGAEPEEAEATTTTTPTSSTSSTSSTATAGSPADEEAALVDRLLATLGQYWIAYDACLSETATCDVEADLGHLIGEPHTSSVEAFVAELAADRTNLRAELPVQYYVQHGVVFENPLTYGIQVCGMAGDSEWVRVDDDGTEEIVQAAGQPTPRIEEYGIEERADGTLIVVSAQSSPDPVEGGTCETYRR